MNGLTHLDLFSGIGGFALAAQSAGFTTVGFAENDRYASALLADRFPRVRNYGDVTRRESFAHLRDGVLAATGGFPCQPWSNAGDQLGADDHRHLWPANRDILRIVRPAWFIGENVPGIVPKGGLDLVLSDLAAEGYAVQAFDIPALAVNARHKRARIWIVAYSESNRRTFRYGEHIGRSANHSGRGSQPCGACSSGGAETLAHADSVRREAVRQLRAGNPTLGGGGEIVANSSSSGRQKWNAPTISGGAGYATGCDHQGGLNGSVESGVGRTAYGLPARLDVSLPGETQFAWEAPRTQRDRCPARSHRLKGCGNAIIPHIPERFLRWIANIEADRAEAARSGVFVNDPLDLDFE